MTTRWMWSAISAVLFAAACSTAAPTANPVGATPAPGSTDAGPVATAGPGGPNASPGTAEIEWDYGPGTFDFPAPASGLAHLESYKSTLIVSFSGTEAGQPSQWSNTYEMLATGDGAERQLTLATAGEGSATPMYRAELNGVAYERRAEATCTAGEIYGPDSLALRWEPAGFLTGVTGAVEVGGEEVNGVAATQYTFDERAFGSLPPSDSTGEMWVATDGAYIVRYLLSTAGTAEYFGEGSEGTLTFDYQLTEINVAPAIEPPADCPEDAVDAPLMPDAADVVRVPGLLIYTTATTPEQVAAFYQQEMPALGWQSTADPTVSETETFLRFTRAGEEISVVLSPGAAGTTVRILVAPIQV